MKYHFMLMKSKHFPMFSWHPFPYLLYLEWSLLGLLLLLLLGKSILPLNWFLPTLKTELSALLVLVFGVLGFYIPINQGFKFKLFFTLLELLIVLLIGLTGGYRGLFLPYIVVVIRACLLFNLIGQLTVASICTLFSLTSWIVIYQRVKSLQLNNLHDAVSSFGVIFLIMAILNFAFIIIMMSGLNGERRSREEISKSHQLIKDQAEELKITNQLIRNQSVLQERQRIAQDIHDSLGHTLTGLMLQLKAGLKIWNQDKQKSYILLEESSQLSKAAIKELRDAIEALKVNGSLDSILINLIEKTKKLTGINFHTDLKIDSYVSPEMKMEIYYIVREGLNNIAKHSKASQAYLYLRTSDFMTIEIGDNGRGFDIGDINPGHGLTGMEKRCQTFGGTFEISSSDSGTTIEVEIPLRSTEL